MKLVRWTPSRNLASSFTRDLEPFFRNSFFNDRGFHFPHVHETEQAWNPVVDVEEMENEVFINAELPGMKKSDIELSIEDNVLTLQGEKKTVSKNGDEGGDSYRSERYFGKFERSFTLPTYVAADQAKAAFKDGVLQITLPKKEEAKSKKITIS
jgi:HSP20 family protein